MDITTYVQINQRQETGRALRLNYGDTMRILAISSVVLVHAASQQCAPLPIFFVGQTWTRWCVPVFFMLSGALLLDPARKESAGEFYRRRLGKIGIPLIFWSLFYIWTNHTSLRIVAGTILAGRPGGGGHLWFIFAILGLYIATPFLRSYIAKSTRLEQWQVALVALVVWSLSSVSWSMLGKTQWRIPPDPSVFTEWIPYFGYFTVGYLLREWTLTRKGIVAASFSALLLSLLSSAGMRYFYSHGQPFRWDGLFCSFLTPQIIITSICVYLLIATLCKDESRYKNTLQTLGTASFGVYLVHLAVLEKLRSLAWFHNVNTSNLLVLELWMGTLLLSCVISLVLIKIPLLKRIV